MWGLDDKSGGAVLDVEEGRADAIAAVDTDTGIAGSADSDRTNSDKTPKGPPSNEEAAELLKNKDESEGVGVGVGVGVAMLEAEREVAMLEAERDIFTISKNKEKIYYYSS
jgi:hypothetical protein